MLTEGSYLEYDNSIINGFQLATSAGPLCEEPLMGVCFVIENIIIDYSHDDGDGSSHLDEPDKPDQLTCGNGRIGVIQDSGMSNKVGEWYEIIEAAHSPL